MKANNIIRIPTSLDTSFFKYWVLFLRPFHNLTEREMDILASFIKQRYYLSKVITDNEILEKVTFSDDTKSKVIEECKISVPHFQVILTKFKKRNIIMVDRLNPKFIPNIKEEKGNFQLVLLLDLK